MSVLFTNDIGWVVSHEEFINKLYTQVKKDNLKVNFKLKESLFKINSIYTRKNQTIPKNHNSESSNLTVLCNTKNKKRKSSTCSENYEKLYDEVSCVKKNYELLLSEALQTEIFQNNLNFELNTAALSTAENCYKSSGRNPVTNAFGENSNSCSILTKINNEQYIFPPNCQFHCKNISSMNTWADQIDYFRKFDVILLDPPWWNKYIRRKRAKCSTESYPMLSNQHLKSLPIDELLAPDGLLIVWCTNSEMHLSSLENDFFPSWNVKKVAKWYWLKVTLKGDPICDFAVPPKKQPFEQLIFAVRENRKHNLPPDGKLIISVPSALHSHKPPLCELIHPYTDNNSNCLEIFARYLLPGWVSWGLETCRFQHLSLFEEENCKNI